MEKMFWFLLFGFLQVGQIIGLRYIEVGNRNRFPIWIETQTNNNGPPLHAIVKLPPGARNKYTISDGGWAGRLWAKVGCDDSGHNCEFGQSVPPCPPGGCHPPAETKVEFFFPQVDSPNDAYYDISLVDGFSLASEIIPYQNDQPWSHGSCVRTDCHLPLGECPRNEKNGLGDLTVKGRSNNVVACLSPCKRWNFPPPYGLGRNEHNGDGRFLCCPTPPVSVGECRNGIVIHTEYVNLVRRTCPSAYSYAYDDLGGLHNCKSTTSFVVNFFS